MIWLQAFDVLIDFTFWNFQLSFITFFFPHQDYFKSISLFCFSYFDDEFYLELFFIVLVGEKKYED